MPGTLVTPLQSMFAQRGSTTSQWGKDKTGLVQYQFNQQGFRSPDDYDTAPKFAFFGCSITFGIGVPQHLTFAGRFDNSHNYGICGRYTNHDIKNIIQQFCDSDLYHSQVNMAVVWSERDLDQLPEILAHLSSVPMYHLFTGKKFLGDKHYKFPPELDRDVSGTHPGPHTHDFVYRSLCVLFKQ